MQAKSKTLHTPLAHMVGSNIENIQKIDHFSRVFVTETAGIDDMETYFRKCPLEMPRVILRGVGSKVYMFSDVFIL